MLRSVAGTFLLILCVFVAVAVATNGAPFQTPGSHAVASASGN